MPEFNLPPIGWSESDAGKNHPFGCVGVTSFINGSYQLEHNSQGSLIDGLITFKDILYIEDWFKRKDLVGYTSPIPQEQQLQDAEIVASGLNTPVYKDGTGGMWKDVIYSARDNDNLFDTGQPSEPYRALIKYLEYHTSKLKLADLNLDNVYDKTDYDIYDYFIDNQQPSNNVITGLNYLYGTLSSISDTDERVYTTFQLWSNGCVTSNNPSTQIFGGKSIDDRELSTAIYEGMLSDIYEITKYPTDTAVIVGNSGITLTVTCGKVPTMVSYLYKWELEDFPNSPYSIMGESNVYTLGSQMISEAINGKLLTLTIYDQLQALPSGADPSDYYDDTDYYSKYIYSVHLYARNVNDILWGDIDNNGVVNIIDAYRILNNFLYLKGDVNRSESINSIDASLALGYYALLSTGRTPSQATEIINNKNGEKEFIISDFLRADMNNDGYVNPKDATYILQVYSSLSVGLTQEEVEDLLHISLNVNSVIPRTNGELAGLVKSTSTANRPTQFTKECGELILESIKNKDVKLY